MNTKKVIAGIVACCIVGGAVPYSVMNINSNNTIIAEAATTYGNFKLELTTDLSDGSQSYAIAGHTDEFVEEINDIPAEVDGIIVNTIAEKAFLKNKYLESIKIPSNIVSIGGSAFPSSLKSIEFSEGLKYIGSFAFHFSKITSVKLPEGLKSIGSNAFEESQIISIEFPESLTSIGSCAFEKCVSLKTVKIPDSVTEIGGSAFSGCKELESVELGKGLTKIANLMFSNTAIKSITIPENVETIEKNAFSGIASLESVEFSEGLKSIGNYAFNGCKITSVKLPESLKSIGLEAFINCPITSLELSEGLKTIDKGAFSGCPLKTVKIPDSVTETGNSVFNGCKELESVELGKGLTKVANSMFSNTAIKSITIPENVETIESAAFSKCSALESITIENPECKIYDSSNTFSKSATIYGYEGSTAQAYAEKYDRKFELIGSEPTTDSPAESTLIGDANCDGEVNIADATAIVQAIGNKDRYALSEQGEKNADCYNTGDGVTGLDAMAIQKLEAKQLDKLPEMPEK